MDISVVNIDDNTAEIVLKGDFGIYSTVEFKKTVNAQVEENQKKYIICNLKEVAYIDSSGIGALMVCLSTMKKVDGRLILIHTYDAVKKVLELTKMTSFFEIFDSLDEALKSVSA